MIEGAIRTGGVKGLSGELPGHVHYGTEGPPGGHYIPKVNQTGEKTAVITFTASKPDMPAVAPVEIDLPVGPPGEKGEDGNVTFDELTEEQREMLRGPEGPAGQPGRDGIDGVDGVTPHIGSNGNWFIGNTDTGKPSRGAEGQAGQPGKDGQDYVLTPADKTEIANMAAGLVEVPEVSGGGYVVQDTPPEDTSVLWVDPTDNTEDAIPDTGGGIAVTGAKVGQTVKIAEVDENGVPTAWEPTDFPSGGGATEEVWEDVCDVTIGADVRTQHILTAAEGKKYKKLYAAFSGVGTNALICCQRDEDFPDTFSSVNNKIASSVKLFSGGTYTGVLLDKDEFGRFKTTSRYSGVGPDADTTSIKVQPIISRAGSSLDKEYINALTLYSNNNNALTAGGKLTIKGVCY